MTPPTLRGLDHVGITVPDVEAATRFLIEAFGAEMIYRSFDPTDPPVTGPDLERFTGVAAGTVMRAQRLLRLGRGPDVELFQMDAPDQRPAARGSDVGVNHVAVYVDDPAAAIARFERAGGVMLSGPIPVLFGAERGDGVSFCYGRTPWGMSVEFITYPGAMAYEATTPLRRWGTELRTPQQDPSTARPFWADTPPTTSRRGHFWVAGDRVTIDGQTFQRGPMFVQWEAPERVTRPYPIVLVHGGTFQGLEWMETPDGRPGWATRLVEAGYAVLVVDRPGHGRSPFHPAVIGPPGPPFSYERGRQVYFPADQADRQTRWPFDPADGAAYDGFMAGYGPMPADLARSQEMDADRLARLLDRIGPAVVMTHSASGPAGWLVADRRPGLVRAVVSVEPMGPPFATTPGIGTLDWGVTAIPVTFDPPRATADEVRSAEPATLRVPAWAGVPMLVVTGETSAFVTAAVPTVTFLTAGGAAAERLHLPDHGITGNGHGLIYETNSDQCLAPVLAWLAGKTGGGI